MMTEAAPTASQLVGLTGDGHAGDHAAMMRCIRRALR